MWDMMLVGGGPYGRRHKGGGHRRSKTHGKCRACREPIGRVTLYGKRVELPYCQRHHCQKVTGSTICQEQRNGRNPNWQYCDMHLRCQAMSGDGFNCMRSVKDGNPERFKYCSEHGCKYAHCEQGKHEGSKGYCREHCCAAAPHNSCDRARLVEEGSRFCETHTCEAQTCRAEVAGRGERGDASRSCESHRRCGREGCSERCHRRDTGVTVRWCGLHYCHEASCQGDRTPNNLNSQYCSEHTCLEPLCGNGRLDMGSGRYCLDHQCRTDRCLERRDQRTPGTDHCALHVCCVDHCPRPAAVGTNRCHDHRHCREHGCREYILVEKGPEGDDIRYPTCDHHHKAQCPATSLAPTSLAPNNRCANRLETGQAYCNDHSCELASCRNQRGLASLQYCDAHKCTLVSCQHMRRNPIPALHMASASLRASLLLGGGAAFLMSSYCAAHACSAPAGCGDRVADLGTSSFCPRHECCHRGCSREATRHPRGRSSAGGYCDRHYRRRRAAAGGGGLPGGPFGPVPMPMGMPMRYPPYFGGQGHYSSGSDSESDSGMRPRGLPFGGLAF